MPASIRPDIAGRSTSEQYRTYGNDLRVSHRDPFGALLFGVWAEHDWQNEGRYAIDLTTGLLYDANKAQKSPVYFDFDAHLNTVQPYAEYTWQPTSDFDVRLGVRYRAVTRDFDASVVQNFLPGTDGTVSKTVYSTLPSLDANYRIAEGFNVYAQVSKGSLVPSQSYFYTSTPAAGTRPIRRRRPPRNSASCASRTAMASPGRVQRQVRQLRHDLRRAQRRYRL